MKIRFLILILILFAYHNSFSQEERDWHSYFYLEAGGPGSIGSINIEHYSIEKEKFKIGARFGLGTSGFRDFTNEINPDFYVPFGVITDFTLLKHKKNTLLLMAGGGLVFASTVHAGEDLLPIREKTLNGYLQIGTSYVISDRLLLRLSYTPILSQSVGLNHWGSISIGHTF